jgi:hypothetical protein
MGRTVRRAILLFASYVGVLLAVIFAGFLGSAVGIWASVVWGVLVIGAVSLYLRRRGRQHQIDAQESSLP